MPRRLLTLSAVTLAAGAAPAGPPTKEPAYRQPPGYLKLTVGPTAAEVVWLALDGDTLHVDKNADGDLTGPGEAVPANPRAAGAPDSGGRVFEAGAVTVAGRTHKDLTVYLTPLADFGSLGTRPDAKKLLKADPKARSVRLGVDVDRPDFRGGGTGGRVAGSAGPVDLAGLLRFAPTPAAAPTVNAGGPLEVTFEGDRPVLKTGRPLDYRLAVGAPGDGPGTFASIGYHKTIPPDAHPVAEVTYPPAKPGGPPVKQRYELKERC